MKIICEGVDRLGKGTLIENIQKNFSAIPVIPCGKPPKVENVLEFQKEFFKNGFEILNQKTSNIIFDRFHLGEYVYGPLYRNTNPNFIFDLELKYINAQCDTILVLLYTKDFSIMEDDGLSFDFNARDKEQEIFFEAFDKSKMKNKIKIRVDNGVGGYRSPIDIFNDFKNFTEVV